MCGIDGFFTLGAPYATDKYYSSHMLLKHRGPDDEGFVSLVDGKIRAFRGDDTINYFNDLKHINTVTQSKMILGHRRLSIIDLSHNGHQPILDQSGNYAIVYNGELFNYLELKKELMELGHSFFSDTDTEVVLKAYIQWKDEAFNKFNGMWAIAIYNKIDNTLLLCRDRFGIKPLFYAWENDVLYFSSEMKFIREFMPKSTNLNKESIEKYLNHSYLNYSEKTFWSEINELLPGHYLILSGLKIKIAQYWNFRPGIIDYSEKDALEKFAFLFEDSIKLRMRSDVEVGALLSGGLDSTLTVCTLDKLGLLNKDFKVFSAVYNEEIFSEKKYIVQTLEKLNLEAEYVCMKPEDIINDLPNLLYHMEEPIGTLSTFSEYYLFKKIKDFKNVKVILSGQGADELFAGYTTQYYSYFVNLLKRGNINKLIREVNEFTNNRKVGIKSFILLMAYNIINSLGNKDYFLDTCYENIKIRPLREYLRDDDRISMSVGVEVRPPFLDYRLVEFAFTLHESYKIDNFTNKKIVRDYGNGIIPSEILNRRDKMGFVTPQELWLKNQLRSELESISLDSEIIEDEYADKRRKNRFRKYLNNDNNDWAYAWRLYCLRTWLHLSGRL